MKPLTNRRDDATRRLVRRLLKRAGLTETEPPGPSAWATFLESTAALLEDLGQDRYLLEQSLETSSQEMLSLYEDLRASTERLTIEHDELRSTSSMLAATLESTADGILVVDLAGRITSSNGRFAAMWGLGLPERILQARDINERLSFVMEQLCDPEAFIAKVQELHETPDAVSHDTLDFTDGRVFERDSLPQRIDGAIVGRVWNFRDITEQHRLQRELQHLAFHDSLTGLANRTLFDDHVTQALRRQARTGGLVAVAVIDLDGFKHINDSFGHQTGDKLLVAIADRFCSTLREVDTIARLGGDEFAMLVDYLDSPEQAGRIGVRILDSLSQTLRFADREVTIGASVGIALGTGTRTGLDDLLGHADAAMYRAKNDGKGCYRIFEPAMHTAVVDRLNLEQALRKATFSRVLSVYYQPIVAARTGRVVSFEALARWDDTERGFVPPSVFVPLAEEAGLILDIGRSVLLDACRQAMIWHATFPQLQPGIAVNVSGRQLLDPGFVNIVKKTLARTGLDPHSLTLEITESILAADTSRVIAMLDELRRVGVRIAIDDFGTGYSSFATLSELPVDTLKIDKRFIDKILDDTRGRGLIEAIVRIAQTLELDTIAEGVERSEQQQSLVELGCEHLQGYLFARPMPADDTRAYLERFTNHRRQPESVSSALTH
jgi:diguanylate cyclase (GGDEF)-like protein/PAS domain S-box-containing protein